MMRRLAVALCWLLIVGFTLPVSGIDEVGLHVQLGLPRFGGEGGGQWAASVSAYGEIELDALWTLQFGAGLRSSDFSPRAWLGLSRTFVDHFELLSDVVLRWIPRRGLLSTIGTGMRYRGSFTEKSDIIIETSPLQFRVESREHLFYLVPTFVPSVSLGGALLLDRGWFGGLLTLTAYKSPSRKQSLALFIGNEWYLAVEHATTIFGYRP
ncbi:hypothetical protein ACFLSW_06055 [Candidatus Bipolaricaulota bacterium]